MLFLIKEILPLDVVGLRIAQARDSEGPGYEI